MVMILLGDQSNVGQNTVAVIQAAVKIVWPEAIKEGEVDVVDPNYTFRVQGPFDRNPFIDYHDKRTISKWSSEWGFNNALKLWKANESNSVLDDVLSKTSGLTGSGQVPPALTNLDFGPATVVCSMDKLTLRSDPSAFIREYSTRTKDGKKQNVHLIIQAWKPCFSIDGKYAFICLNAVWSLMHETRLAFLFERTSAGWKLLLRKDTVQL